MNYANVIVDISLEKLDRTFQYRIPEALKEEIFVGTQVVVPFGKGGRTLNAFVVELTDVCEWEPERIKEILRLADKGIPLEGQLIALADWMRRMYGSTMNQALKTVLPVKQAVKEKVERRLSLCVSRKEALKLRIIVQLQGSVQDFLQMPAKTFFIRWYAACHRPENYQKKLSS